jgi:hypothetical protein
MRLRTIITLLPSLLPAPALSDGIYKDREIAAARGIVIESSGAARCGLSLARRTTCSADYVGSEMGLGKPSYYGTRIPAPATPGCSAGAWAGAGCAP